MRGFDMDFRPIGALAGAAVFGLGGILVSLVVWIVAPSGAWMLIAPCACWIVGAIAGWIVMGRE